MKKNRKTVPNSLIGRGGALERAISVYYPRFRNDLFCVEWDVKL